MTSMAFKVGAQRGPHVEIHVYVGPYPGQRARAGTLTVLRDEAPAVVQKLLDGGFDRVADQALFAPFNPHEEEHHVAG